MPIALKMMDRRQFIRTTAAATVGGFTVRGMANPVLGNLLKSGAADDRVLVVVQLFGGNDGLNTVIPLDQYGTLSGMRGNILIPEVDTLELPGTDGATALHPRLTGLRNLWDNGKLSIVQSVGYPDPNLSHFRSTDIWESGSSGNQYLNTGWLGRYLNTLYPNYPNGYPSEDVPYPIAIRIEGSMGLGLQHHGVAMGTTINNTEDALNLAGNIYQDPVLAGCSGYKLAYIRDIQRQTDLYGDVIEAAAATNCPHSSLYPTGSAPGAELANALKIVATLICGGLGTKIYWVSITGFDTHSNQVNSGNVLNGVHADLLQGVSDSINAFQDDVQQMGISDRVLGMTFSEFGRRVWSNNSRGTDHGAAAPLFLFGDAVVPGMLGSNPVIAPETDDQTNVPMVHDFRSVYASVLEQWFCLEPAEVETVLLGSHPSLPIINQQCSVGIGAHHPTTPGELTLNVAPSPFTERTTVTYTCAVAGNVKLQVMNAMGQLVAQPVNKVMAPGRYSMDLDMGPMPAGMYFCRLQNGPFQQVRNMMKVR
jgi:uncharacterized protein (DUF1501 family)